MDYFEACKILDVNPDEDIELVKKVYITKMRKHHPDLAIEEIDKKNSEEMAKQINMAYDCICEYRKHPVSSAELFNDIFSAFTEVIRRYGSVVEDEDGFIIDISSFDIWDSEEDEEDNLWDAER